MVLFIVGIALGDMNIAYIDTDRVMIECQDTQEAQQLFQSEQLSWTQEIQEMDEEIQRLQDDFEQKKLILTETRKAEAQEKINELRDERERRLEEIFGDNGLAMQKNAELLEPILINLQKIIEEISMEQNIDMVLDASTGGILYAVPRLDITDEVIDMMNDITDVEDN